jgi:hypothetical protein
MEIDLVADNCPNRIVYMAGQTDLHGSSSSIQPTFTSGAEIRGRNSRSLKFKFSFLNSYWCRQTICLCPIVTALTWIVSI